MTSPATLRTRPAAARLLSALGEAIRGGSTFLFVGYMLGNVIAYVYQMLMSRALAPAHYGALVALTSLYYILAVAVKAVQAWMISATAGTGGEEPIHPGIVLLGAIRVVLPAGLVVFTLGWLGSGTVAAFLNIGDSAPVKVLGLYICTEFLEALVIGTSLGLKMPRLAGAVITLEPIVRIVAGLAFVATGMGVTGAMLGFPLGNLAAFSVALLVLGPLLARRDRSAAAPRKHPQPLDRYALVALAVNVGLMLMINVDQVVVKHFFPPDVAGNYAVAWILGRVIAITTISFGWVVFSSSASLALDDPKRAWVLARGLLAIGGISGVCTAVFFAVPGLLVRVMTGSSYTLAPHYVGLIGVEMTLFALVYVQAYYHLSVRRLQVAWLLAGSVAMEVVLLAIFHSSIEQVLTILILLMAGLLAAVSALSVSILRSPKPLSAARTSQVAATTTSEAG